MIALGELEQLQRARILDAVVHVRPLAATHDEARLRSAASCCDVPLESSSSSA